MIISGDIAVPDLDHVSFLSEVLTENPQVFKSKTLLCNLEGMVNDNPFPSIEPVLHNHPAVLKLLRERGDVITALANNHVLDLPHLYERTVAEFTRLGISYAGAGKNREEAQKPVSLYDDGIRVIVFNACWEFLLYNHRNPTDGIYISVIDEERLLRDVTFVRKEQPQSAIIISLHWNFDLEILPFPMHRQFARALIDAGADLVVGAHSHCVQGGEKYGSGYIVYGLGNFYLPQGVFAGNKLTFPPFSNVELVLEWSKATRKAICHWFEYQQQGRHHSLVYLSSEEFENSDRLKSYSHYAGMGENEYLHYFRKNRRKKIIVPVYRDFRKKRINTVFSLLLKNRARIGRLLARSGLHKWQN